MYSKLVVGGLALVVPRVSLIDFVYERKSNEVDSVVFLLPICVLSELFVDSGGAISLVCPSLLLTGVILFVSVLGGVFLFSHLVSYRLVAKALLRSWGVVSSVVLVVGVGLRELWCLVFVLFGQ